jgi:hypothetical protein
MVLCARQPRGTVEHPASDAKQRTSKGRPSFERAKRVVDELYPNGLPDSVTLPNNQLFKQVDQSLKGHGLLTVSDATILRAAGRRK